MWPIGEPSRLASRAIGAQAVTKEILYITIINSSIAPVNKSASTTRLSLSGKKGADRSTFGSKMRMQMQAVVCRAQPVPEGKEEEPRQTKFKALSTAWNGAAKQLIELKIINKKESVTRIRTTSYK